jgi:hypothetical protein
MKRRETRGTSLSTNQPEYRQSHVRWERSFGLRDLSTGNLGLVGKCAVGAVELEVAPVEIDVFVLPRLEKSREACRPEIEAIEATRLRASGPHNQPATKNSEEEKGPLTMSGGSIVALKESRRKERIDRSGT